MTIEIRALPWSDDAMEPIISQRTIEHHYYKHHMGYVKKLNELLQQTDAGDLTLDEVLIRFKDGPIWNNAAQHINHEFYWESLSPQKLALPDVLQKLIEKTFGSVDEMKKQLISNCVNVFGSGWVWITYSNDKIYIEKTSNAAFPQNHALLVIDVWEHAYYLDYQQNRAEHVTKLIEYLNWDKAIERLTSSK